MTSVGRGSSPKSPLIDERVILPRLDDAIKDASQIIQKVGVDAWEACVLDFEDAFKQLVVANKERKHLSGRALDGVVCYKRVLFGIRSGPLVWGRAAALLMRITAILQHGQPARTECFVDDPLFILGGAKPPETASSCAPWCSGWHWDTVSHGRRERGVGTLSGLGL